MITDITEKSSASDAHIQEVKLAQLLPSHAGAAAVAELLLWLQAEKAAVLCSETGSSFYALSRSEGKQRRRSANLHLISLLPSIFHYHLPLSPLLPLILPPPPNPHQLHSGRRPLKASSNVSGRLLV